MNRLLKVLTAGSLILAVGACASRPAEVAEKSEEPKRSCVKETGTRIENEKDECQGPGRTYTREDLERTGGATTGEAVRRMGVR